MDIQNKIRALMEARGWTIYKLARETGVSWSTIRNMFNRNTAPTIPTLEALCTGLGITLTELLLGDGYPELSDEHKELLTLWNRLSPKDKRLYLELLRAMDAKK